MPIRTCEVEHAQRRRKARRLADPVEHQRSRQHHQRRALRSRDLCPARLQQREHHHGLAKAHVVGEAAAETEVAEKAQPTKRFTLIVAQPTDERHRRILGSDAGEVLHPLARFDEAFVPIDRRLSGQQRLDQTCLRRTKSHHAAGMIGQRHDRRNAGQPLLGQDTNRAIAQRDRPLPLRQGSHHGRKIEHDSVLGGRFQFEPIDPGSNLEFRRRHGAVANALCFDVPAVRDQGVHHRRQAAFMNARSRRHMMGFDSRGTELSKPGNGLPLDRTVARIEPTTVV